MAEQKGFDLSALLKGVSNLNTAEQIVLLPLDLIDPDPENFYSLDGLEDLAGNIELVGLLDPIRVRPDGERYTVVSGHRRRAACLLIRDGGSEQFKDGVPCIVEYGEASDAMRKLRLIYANSNTRQLTSAEQSKQAEEVTRLLYELKEQGVEFPGRMRDHVAAAVNVNKSKLARLHAIRNNLVPEALALFDSEELNEACAYELQKLPAGVQRYLAQQKKIGPKMRGFGIQQVQRRLDEYMNPSCKCPSGERCTHTYPRIKQTVVGIWECTGKCCLKCHRSQNECPYRCKQSKDDLAAKKANMKASAERAQKEREKLLEENRAVLTGKYVALDILAREKKLPDDLAVVIPGCQTIADLHERADGKGISDYKAANTVVFDWYTYVGYAEETADLLGVSVDFLLGRTPAPEVNRGAAQTQRETPGCCEIAAPQWQTGTPPRAGRYFCRVKGNYDNEDEPAKEFRFDWDGETWFFTGRPIFKGMMVLGWWPLPDVPGEEP